MGDDDGRGRHGGDGLQVGDELPDTVGGAVRRGLRSTVGRESTTFGFSILVTVTFGILQTSEGTPDAGRVFLYAVGAALSRGYRRPMPQHRTRVQAVGSSMNVLSVVGGLGAGWLVGVLMTHATVWLVAPFVAATLYLLLESLETALAERLLLRAGDDSAREVSP